MEIREYIAPLLKWWWLIVLSTLIAGGTSYYMTQQQPPLYRTTTTIIVGSAAIDDPNPSNSELNITQQLASFYVDLANRQSVRSDTKDALGIDALPGVMVSALNNTNVIDITVTDTSPERAQAVANELANQLMLRSPTAQQAAQERDSFVNEQLDSYQAAINEAEQEIREKQESLGELVSASEIREVQNDINSLELGLSSLRRDYATLLGSTQQGAINVIRVIEPATLPRRPINSNDKLSVLTAAAIGFVLSVSAAFVLEYLDDTVKTSKQVSRLIGLPALADIVRLRDAGNGLVTIAHPRSPASEAFRVLRTGIQYSSLDNPNRTMLVTSAMPVEGKSTIAANLAVVLAQAGHRVLLVDSDLRRPSQHNIFDLPNKRGLTSLLLDFDPDKGEDDVRYLIQDIAQVTRVGGLKVLTSGPVPPNPSELLGSAKMKTAVNALLSHFDYLIFDSPPVLSVTDAVVMSTQVDATLLVVRANKSRRSQVQHSAEKLRDVHANLIGVIVNSLPPKEAGIGSYYYYSNDTYLPDEEPPVEKSKKPSGKLRERFSRGGKKAVSKPSTSRRL